ncbi:hypothetical protein Hanom_Chr16g01459391 [Helianthus anomalus]
MHSNLNHKNFKCSLYQCVDFLAELTSLVTEQLATTENHPHSPNSQYHHPNLIPGDHSQSRHNTIGMAQIEPQNSARLWADSCILNKSHSL